MSRHLKRDGTRAPEILCRDDFQIRGRVLESRANGGNGAERSCARTGPYLARQLLINLRRLMCDRTKPTMTYAKVHTSDIGTTLTSFIAQMKIDLSKWEAYLEAHMDDLNKNSYLRIVNYLRQAILDIDSITKLLIELVTDNGADSYGLEGLGLPESEPINDNDRVNDEEEEGDY